jgi:nucleotide-binding universal stress UspA family protein
VPGAASRDIVDTAKRYNVDLIVLGSQGHGKWKRLLPASVVPAVALQTECRSKCQAQAAAHKLN